MNLFRISIQIWNLTTMSITILIVEDEGLVAEDLAGKLRRLGYEVAGITAEGEEAVAIAHESARISSSWTSRWAGRWTASERRRRSEASST